MEEEGYDTKSLSCSEGTIICVIAVGEERREGGGIHCVALTLILPLREK